MAATQNAKNGDSVEFSAVTATTFTGNLTGNVTGNVVGNVTGNVTGGILHPVTTLSADGAVTIPSVDTIFKITKAGVCALTLADPSADNEGLILHFVSTTANAHTLSNAAGSGFNSGGAASDVGTFGAAAGNGIRVIALGSKWYVLNSVNVTLA